MSASTALRTAFAASLTALLLAPAPALASKGCKALPLDVAALGRSLKKVDLDAAEVSRAVTRGRRDDLSFDHLVDAGAGRTVAIWTGCKAGRCGGTIAVLERSKRTKTLRMTARSLMPFDETPFEPFGGLEIGSVAIANVDGDRAPELLVEYGFSGEPEPAVGAKAWGYLGIWNLPSLGLAWSAEIKRGGQAGVHETCIPDLRRSGPKCGKGPWISLQRTCGTGYCFTEDDQPAEDCDMDRPTKGPLETFTWRRDEDVLWKAGHDAPKRLADGKPWMVIALSYPLTGPEAASKPEEKRDALKAAGFADAEILDSRRVKKLACCYRTVVAGRFATKAEAEARLEQLEARKVRGAYVKRGF